MKNILVYLDGMVYSDNRAESEWQDKVMAALEDFTQQGIVTFFDPRKSPKEPEKYRPINEDNWKKADIIFTHDESSGSSMIFISKPKRENPEKIQEEKKPEYPPNFTEVFYHREATSLAEGIDMLKDEIEITILRKFTP